ncbi:MAG: hypothetical protein PHV13_03260 [Candidatus ainarchaeum sp.]|nr:hypothetical protein [Candidatus ainarchaeum sp.]
MHYRYVVMFLLIFGLAFADCAGYNESFDARVLDAKLRPIPNASVSVTYDRGATFGEKYFTTPPQQTNSAGIVHFTLSNQGTNTRAIDCNIVVRASVSGINRSVTIEALKHGTPVDVTMPKVYPLSFYVRDSLGRPLPNATVTISGTSRTTDADGLAAFFLALGSYDYMASYMDGGQPGSLEIKNDTSFEAVLRSYRITVEVTDDLGNPLPSTLYIFNRTFNLENGTFEYAKTFGSLIPYRTEYRGMLREGMLEPAVSTDAKVVYDIHAPLFGEIRPEMSNGRYRLIIPVSDPGESASGVDFEGFRVDYRVEPAEAATPWNQAATFTSGRNVITAEFPALPPDSIVSFRVEMSDEDGNRASIEGRFSTLAVQTPANNTQNQTITQPSTGPEQGIPLLYIFIGAIVALLIVYVVFRIKAQGGGGG